MSDATTYDVKRATEAVQSSLKGHGAEGRSFKQDT